MPHCIAPSLHWVNREESSVLHPRQAILGVIPRFPRACMGEQCKHLPICAVTCLRTSGERRWEPGSHRFVRAHRCPAPHATSTRPQPACRVCWRGVQTRWVSTGADFCCGVDVVSCVCSMLRSNHWPGSWRASLCRVRARPLQSSTVTMGGGNAQKSAIARERNAAAAKARAGGK